jgi:hypothetical protein
MKLFTGPSDTENEERFFWLEDTIAKLPESGKNFSSEKSSYFKNFQNMERGSRRDVKQKPKLIQNKLMNLESKKR